MDNRAEMAVIVSQELQKLIQPVQVLTLNPNRSTGEVSGRFRSNELIFEYSIKDGGISYAPLRGTPAAAREDAMRSRGDAVAGGAMGGVEPDPYTTLGKRIDGLAQEMRR
jgi:hypothetical protein